MAESRRADIQAEAFRAAWEEPGSIPRLEDFLVDVQGEERLELFQNLLAVEIEQRARYGHQPPDWEALQTRFPEYQNVLRDRALATEISLTTSLPNRASTAVSSPFGTDVPDTKATIGKYQILQTLGSGGQAVTYLANDPDLERHVVIKEYHQCANEREQELVLNEGRALARVRSQYVARCLTVERDEDRVYLVMEFIRGAPLSAARQHVVRSPRDAAQFVAMVAEGLYDVHLRGLVHRDIKPANILVCSDGTPRLVDFGLAAAMASDALEQFGGTLQFMSPEQANSHVDNIDLRTDIFGLGAVLYWLLVDQPPYNGRTREEVWAKAKAGIVTAPQHVRGDLPAELSAICMRAMAFQPQNRFSSASEFSAALHEWLDEETAEPGGLRSGAALAADGADKPAKDLSKSLAATGPISPNPYKGLESFGEADADRYFGRETYVQRGLERIGDAVKNPGRTRFLAIVGASGSGKSSLAHAGILARLKRAALPESHTWIYIQCRPGHDPIEGLAIALGAHPDAHVRDPGELMRQMRSEDNRLHLTSRLALHGRDPQTQMVIVVDQFEELFRSGDAGTKQAYIRNLLHAATAQDGRTFVLLTMRADFYAKASVYPDLADVISREQILVGPMTEAELFDAIRQPAEQAGVAFETGLVEMLVRDMRREPGALPFLQDALTQLWEMQHDRRLTVESYKQIGRLEGAIEHRANQFFESLDAKQQDICRRIFLRLTQPGEGTEDTKRRVARDELGMDEDTEHMIQRLARARLITAEGQGEDAQGEVAYVEVSHEALIRAWSKLRRWIDEDRDALRFQHQLTVDAAAWKRAPDDAFLYRGAKLVLAEEWRQTHEDALTEIERQFLAAGQALRDRERQERATAAKRLRRWAWTAGAAALVASLMAVAALNLAFRIDRSRANEQQQRALADQRAREAQHQSAITEAQRLATHAEDLLEESPLRSAQLAGDAVRLVFGNEGLPLQDEDARYPLRTLREAIDELDRRRNELVLGTRPPLIAPMTSPSGRWLVSQMYDREVSLWDLQNTDAPPIRLPKPGEDILEPVFSPDDQWLVAHSTTGNVRLWKLGDSQAMKQFELTRQTGENARFAFDRTSRWLLATDTETTRIWDLQREQPDAKPVRVLRSVGEPALATFCGKWLLFDGGQGTSLWPLDTLDRPHEPQEFPTHTLRVNLLDRGYAYGIGWLFDRDELDQPKQEIAASDDGRWVLLRERESPDSPVKLLDLDAEAPQLQELPLPRSWLPFARNRRGIRPTQFLFNSRTDRLLAHDEDTLVIWPLVDDKSFGTPETIAVDDVRDLRFLTPTLVSVVDSSSGRSSSSPSASFLSLSASVFDLSDIQARRIVALDREFPIAASADGNWLVAAAAPDGMPVVYHLRHEDPLTQRFALFSDTNANHLLFTPKSDWLVVAKEDSVLMWNLSADQPLTSMKVLAQSGADRSINGVLAPKNGTQILVVGDWSTQRYRLNDATQGWLPAGILTAYRQQEVEFPSYDHGWIVDCSGELPYAIDTRAVSDPSRRAGFEFGKQRAKASVILDDDRFVVALDDGTMELWGFRDDAVRFLTSLSAVPHAGRDLLLSPDRRWLVAASHEGTVRVWDTGKWAAGDYGPTTLSDHGAPMVGMAIDPDSKWLALRSYDGIASLRSLERPEDFRVMSGDESRWARIARDDPTNVDLVAGDDWTTPLWNARLQSSRTGREQYSESQLDLFGNAPRMREELQGITPETLLGEPQLLHNGRAVRSDWSPDGEKIVFGGSRGLVLIDVGTGEAKSLLPFGKDPAWSPATVDGSWIAFVGGQYSNREEIWIARPDGSESRRVAEGGFPTWSDDGRLWFRGGNATGRFELRYFDLSDQQVHEVPSVALEAHYPAVSPDGTMLAQRKFDPLGSSVLVSNIQTGKTLLRWEVPGSNGLLLSWSPDSRYVTFGTYAAGDDAIGIWALDVQNEIARQIVKGPYTRAVWNRAGNRIAFDIRLSPYEQLWTVSAEKLDQLPTYSHRDFLAKVFDDYREALAVGKLDASTPIQVEMAYHLRVAGLFERGLNALRLAGANLTEQTAGDARFDARYYALLAGVLAETGDTEGFPSATECRQRGVEALRKAYESGQLSMAESRADPILRWLSDDDSHQSLEQEYATAKELINELLAQGQMPKQQVTIDLFADGRTVHIPPNRKVVTNQITGRTRTINGASSLDVSFETYTVLGFQARGIDARAPVWRALGKLWNLESVDLTDAKLDADVIEAIVQLPNLRELRLANVTFTDEHAQRFSDQSKLDTLELRGTDISDQGLAVIATLPRLTVLDVSDTSVTNQGLAQLANAPRLRYLKLRNVPLDSSAIEALASIPHLVYLDASNTGLSDEDLGRLQETIARARGTRRALELAESRHENFVVPLELNGIRTRDFRQGMVVGRERDGFGDLGNGMQQVAGIRFQIPEQILTTAESNDAWNAPARAASNKQQTEVGFRLERLLFLHGARSREGAADAPEGTVLASYTVRYADGQAIHIPVIMGQNVRDWWDDGQNAQNGAACREASIAWAGFNQKSRSTGDNPACLRLYLFAWENPRPDVAVEAVTLDPFDTSSRRDERNRRIRQLREQLGDLPPEFLAQQADLATSDADSDSEQERKNVEVFCLAISAAVQEDVGRKLAAADAQSPTKSVEALYSEARKHYQARNYAAAIDSLSNVLLIDPQQASALHLRAHCYISTKVFANAEQDTKQLLQMEADVAHFHYMMALIRVMTDQPELAIPSLATATDLVGPEAFDESDREDIFDLAASLANQLSREENHELAIRSFEIALNMIEMDLLQDADDNVSFYNRACFLARIAQAKQLLQHDKPEVDSYQQASVDALESAMQAGYRDWRNLDQDADLDFIRDHPRFTKLLEKYRAPESNEPTAADPAKTDPSEPTSPATEVQLPNMIGD